MSVTISLYKRCSVRLYIQLFVGEFISYLCYLYLYAYSVVHYILCYIFALCVIDSYFFATPKLDRTVPLL
jgi:hypothetical protein